MLISVSTARMMRKSTPPAAQAGHPAEQGADHHVDRDRPEADHERRPRAVDDARPDVAAGPVRAQQVLGARRLADRLDVREERLARDDVGEDGQEHDHRQHDEPDDGEPMAQEAPQLPPARERLMLVRDDLRATTASARAVKVDSAGRPART